MHRKYLFANFRMSHNYRSYKDFVPKYLHGRPHSVIQHCLERISSSEKYSREDIVTTEQSSGLFSIRSNEKTHTVDFGQATGQPSCTCQDWTNWQVPCKHFFFLSSHLFLNGIGTGYLRNTWPVHTLAVTLSLWRVVFTHFLLLDHTACQWMITPQLKLKIHLVHLRLQGKRNYQKRR